MTHRKALKWWEAKEGNFEVTPQALSSITKSLMERDGPEAPTTVHGPSGITYHLNENANITVDCLENQFTSHGLCDKNHESQVETEVQALLASGDDIPKDIHKLVNSLKLRKAYGLDGIPNKSSIFQDHWYIYTFI
jgi:hypothetical protein